MKSFECVMCVRERREVCLRLSEGEGCVRTCVTEGRRE